MEEENFFSEDRGRIEEIKVIKETKVIFLPLFHESFQTAFWL